MSAGVQVRHFPSSRAVEIMCGVVFGAPSRSCTGSGVCMVSSVAVLERMSVPCLFVLAFVSFWEGERLIFRFPKSGLELPTDKARFQAGFFLVDEPFTVPRWLMRAWGRPRMRIPSGRYPVHQTIDSWVVHFPINQKKTHQLFEKQHNNF